MLNAIDFMCVLIIDKIWQMNTNEWTHLAKWNNGYKKKNDSLKLKISERSTWDGEKQVIKTISEKKKKQRKYRMNEYGRVDLNWMKEFRTEKRCIRITNYPIRHSHIELMFGIRASHFKTFLPLEIVCAALASSYLETWVLALFSYHSRRFLFLLLLPPQP